jgi:hypothetical protein
MTKLIEGDKVKWIAKMMGVPHPEGKTDRLGEVLPVFRNTERIGVVVSSNGGGESYRIRPNGDHKVPEGMPTYYDITVKVGDLTKI